jgi:hypothetical protein
MAAGRTPDSCNWRCPKCCTPRPSR